MKPWIGVDFDGVLAVYERGQKSLGMPVEPMRARIDEWISQGIEVRVFTTRAGDPRDKDEVIEWLKLHGFPNLPVTNVKEAGMLELWDDRAVQVERNTGRVITSTPLSRQLTNQIFGRRRSR